jgi:hypothetical protein
MKIEDFAEILYSKTGEKKILAYKVFHPDILEMYFQQCNYKPVVLAEKLNIHYQSLRKLLIENGFWNKVNKINGKGAGINRRRFQQGNRDGYLYSENPNSVSYKDGRCRRKMKHIEVMEQKLGRVLNTNEIVHHIDCNKINNTIDNLYLCSKKEHGIIHKQLESLAALLVQHKMIIFINGKYEFTEPAKRIIQEQLPSVAEAMGWV